MNTANHSASQHSLGKALVAAAADQEEASRITVRPSALTGNTLHGLKRFTVSIRAIASAVGDLVSVLLIGSTYWIGTGAVHPLAAVPDRNRCRCSLVSSSICFV